MHKSYTKWRAGNAGGDMMRWFVYRKITWHDGVDRSSNEYAKGPSGRVRMFKSTEAAKKVADELNKA